eukprot:8272898-Pyramimonas_sp.AAC.1
MSTRSSSPSVCSNAVQARFRSGPVQCSCSSVGGSSRQLAQSTASMAPLPVLALLPPGGPLW